jgi:hypothetical protein
MYQAITIACSRWVDLDRPGEQPWPRRWLNTGSVRPARIRVAESYREPVGSADQHSEDGSVA